MTEKRPTTSNSKNDFDAEGFKWTLAHFVKERDYWKNKVDQLKTECIHPESYIEVTHAHYQTNGNWDQFTWYHHYDRCVCTLCSFSWWENEYYSASGQPKSWKDSSPRTNKEDHPERKYL